MSAWSLERCRYCKGLGILGRGDDCNILCERCEGTGLGWTERCALEYKAV